MGGEWDFDRDSYLAMVREEIPAYDSLQAALADSTSDLSPRRILDLGTGTGMTAAAVLAAHPSAELVGLDGSEMMLSHAHELVPQATLLVGDLVDPLPDGPFDLVVSALAIHHLDAPKKADLFCRMAEVMEPGGRFVLFDVVVPTSPVERPVVLDEEIDKPSTIAEHLEWFGAAGMVGRVIHDHGDLAILEAVRSTSH